MPKSMPSRFDSSAAKRTKFHQGSVHAIISGVGDFFISAPKGVVISARLNIVVRLNPAFFSSSKSFVMPSLVMLHPIHIHKTPGFALSGGFIKIVAGSIKEDV